MTIDTSGLIYNRTADAAYECTDLNRVAEFCETIVNQARSEIQFIANLRNQYDVAKSEYSAPFPALNAITVKKDFKVTDTYTIAQMDQYLRNANYVIDNLPPPQEKPMPENMRFLTYDKANNIEENLKQSAEAFANKAEQTENNIKNTAAAFAYSGEIFAGGII